MTKKVLLFVAAFAGIITVGCKKPASIPQEPDDLVPLNQSISVISDLIFTSKPTVTFHIENPNEVSMEAEIKMEVTADIGTDIATIIQNVEMEAKSTQSFDITTEETLAPGFYRASCTVNNIIAKDFNFGISPSEIIAEPDKQADFDTFWDNAIAQLPEINDETITLIEIPSKSSSAVKVYFVEMLSVPDGLIGDAVTVRGYYLEPQEVKKYPVIIHYMGYDFLNGEYFLPCPSGGSSPQFAEFYLSTRGQQINNRKADKREDGIAKDFTNIYGDWFAYNFGKKDSYYYRGAFMDCVQAIRFMASRPTSDVNNIFAEGSSQGGGFAYAAAGLTDIPLRAIASCVAFLGDYPNYFQSAFWPANVARKNQGTMSDEEMYAFLSYFDTKNLATRITCSVIACSTIQDDICPPQTNTAPFNNLSVTDKEMHYYPNLKHVIPKGWVEKYMNFFRDRIQPSE